LPLTCVRNKVADLTDKGDKIKILDVRTGTGTLAFAFAKRGYEIIGIDLSEEMLWVAKKKNMLHRWRHVSFTSLYES
jgi:ubiquinone/menaquinone biosynthesis C-methylase UbiE